MGRFQGQLYEIRNMEDVRREADVLQALGYMVEANLIETMTAGELDKNPLDARYNKMECGITPVKPTSKEYKEIDAYLTGTTRSVHNMEFTVNDVFRVERGNESEKFNQSIYGKTKNPNRALLWHGSRSTNFVGILSQGLRIAPPEAPVSGYMFGKGIYLADMSSKSANYCVTSQSGGTGLILLCEAELGKQLEQQHFNYDAEQHCKDSDCWSTKGMGTAAPYEWKDAGCVHKNLKGVAMVSVCSCSRMVRILMEHSRMSKRALMTVPDGTDSFIMSTFVTTCPRYGCAT
jgi:poly [ADP-ribose] polymerase 2/3/4